MKKTLLTIFDVNGLNEFLNGFDWGTTPDLPYNVDPFCVLKAFNCTCGGPNGNILILEQDSEYIWKVINLNDQTLKLNLLDGINKITLKMLKSGTTSQTDWEKIFVLEDHYRVEDNLLILEEEVLGNKIFNITTKKDYVAQYNLTYSIEFSFILNGVTRYCIIDPFIKVRPND